jgi:uncharacterized protein
MSESTRRKVVTKFEGYGLVGGLALGVLAGVMISGPHFREWPVLQSVLVVLGGGALGSFVGYLALSYLIGSIAAGPGGGLGGGGDGGIGGGDYGGGSGGDGGGGGDG